MIIADSHVKAAKSGQARDMFNARVASYHLGLAVLKSAFGGSRLKNRLEYVRDLDPQRLGCTTSDVYRLLLQVPQFMSRKDLKKSFPASIRN